MSPGARVIWLAKVKLPTVAPAAKAILPIAVPFCFRGRVTALVGAVWQAARLPVSPAGRD